MLHQTLGDLKMGWRGSAHIVLQQHGHRVAHKILVVQGESACADNFLEFREFLGHLVEGSVVHAEVECESIFADDRPGER